jgi:hypothetical protein
MSSLYYADPTGSDSTGTGTSLNPWKTFEHGVATMPDDGSTLVLRTGSYAGFELTRKFVNRSRIWMEAGTVITGQLDLEGSSALTVRGPYAGPRGIAASAKIETIKVHGENVGLQFSDLEITTGLYTVGTGAAVSLSFKNRWVKFTRVYMHHIATGVTGGHIGGNLDINRSRYLHFIECTMEDIHGDIFELGSWEDIRFFRCYIKNCGQENPTDEPHPDHIQLTGDVHRMLIDSCFVLQTATAKRTGGAQMLFFQAETGPISNLKVVNSLIASQLTTASVAVTQEGATGAEFIYNDVITPNMGGGYWLDGNKGATTDSIEVGNIFSSWKSGSGSTSAVRDYNLYMAEPASMGAHDIVAADPKFVNLPTAPYEEDGNYELQASSPAKEAGETTYAPKVDILGRPRGSKPSIGCYQ